MKFFVIYLMRSSIILGLTACSYSPQVVKLSDRITPHQELMARVKSKPNLAVLFVGNSYSFGVPKAFSKLATVHNKQVRCGHSTFGGWTLKQHAANESTLNKIRKGHWDIVVFQEQSEIPAMSPGKRARLMFPPLRKLAQEARSHGAIPVLYQTWGRRDGDANRKHDNFLAMNQRLREGYQAAAKDAGGLVVIPVGDAWEREIYATTGRELFITDGSHPNAFGDEVTAEVFYQFFWK
jgi:hypothetical protein